MSTAEGDAILACSVRNTGIQSHIGDFHLFLGQLNQNEEWDRLEMLFEGALNVAAPFLCNPELLLLRCLRDSISNDKSISSDL